MKTNWFQFKMAAQNPSVAQIHIIDFIGGWYDDAANRYWNEDIGVTARAFGEKLAALPDTVTAIHLHINSPGGDVQGGINIANMLREQQAKGRTVETFIDGLAASIASVIAMAGSKVHMADNALMMIHDPWTIEIGNAAQMRKTADTLDTMRDQAIATYQWHSKLSHDEIAALMAEDTWMTADDAIAFGFATDKVEGLKAAASISRGVVGKALKVPEEFRAQVEAFLAPAETPAPPSQPAQPVAATAADLLPLCQAAGASMDFMAALLKDGLTLEQAQARIEADRNQRESAQQRERVVRGLCAEAKLPLLADGLVQGGMSVDAVKAFLVTVKGLVDRSIDIDGTELPPASEDAAASWRQVFEKVGRAGRAR